MALAFHGAGLGKAAGCWIGAPMQLSGSGAAHAQTALSDVACRLWRRHSRESAAPGKWYAAGRVVKKWSTEGQSPFAGGLGVSPRFNLFFGGAVGAA